MKLNGKKAVVCGAGGFIGGHLVQSLLDNGVDVIRAVDIKPLDEWYQTSNDVENLSLDLKDKASCLKTAADADIIFNLAADMGGMGFIENNKALCMLSVLINTHLLHGRPRSRRRAVLLLLLGLRLQRDKQTNPNVVRPQGRGRLPRPARRRLRLGETLLRAHVPALREDFGLAVPRRPLPQRLRPATAPGRRPREGPGRHLPQGHRGQALRPTEIEIWGDGQQTRCFMYIDDCTLGTRIIAESDIHEPINLGSDELVTINQLVDIVEEIAGVKLKRNYNLDAPKGVNGRNSDNTQNPRKAQLGTLHQAPRRPRQNIRLDRT